VTLTLSEGVANVYVGEPGAASHRVLGVLRRGEAFSISGLDTDSDQVVSVQSNAGFEISLRTRGAYYPEGKVIPSSMPSGAAPCRAAPIRTGWVK